MRPSGVTNRTKTNRTRLALHETRIGSVEACRRYLFSRASASNRSGTTASAVKVKVRHLGRTGKVRHLGRTGKGSTPWTNRTRLARHGTNRRTNRTRLAMHGTRTGSAAARRRHLFSRASASNRSGTTASAVEMKARHVATPLRRQKMRHWRLVPVSRTHLCTRAWAHRWQSHRAQQQRSGGGLQRAP